MPYADIILKNANAITMDAGKPTAGVIAIKGGEILFVGAKGSEIDFKGVKTRVIDLEGRTLLPGFNDAHVHLFSFIRKLLSLDLRPGKVSCIADIKALVRRQVEKTPPDAWISGTDYSDFYLREKRHPTRGELDEVSPRNPVVLSHTGLHVCVLNSLALRLAKINRETQAPVGTFIERDRNGEPTGVLHELLGYIREEVMPPFTDSEIAQSMALASRHFVSLGITSLQDATVVNDFRRFQIMKHYEDKGIFVPRLHVMFGLDKLPGFREAGLSFLSGDEKLRLGGIKILVTENEGKIFPEQDVLNEMIILAAKAGFPVAIHAAQSQCVLRAVFALEYAQGHLPKIKLRQRIEHLSICLPVALQKLKKLRPVITVQPAFVFSGGDRYLAQTSGEEKPYIFRFRTLLESGLKVAASSDSPIAPDNPFFAVHSAISRKTRSGKTLAPEETITVGDVLKMYTVNAAFASSEERLKESIAPGKLADLVVLDKNPLSASPEEIENIKVSMTIVGGTVVFEA